MTRRRPVGAPVLGGWQRTQVIDVACTPAGQ
jgi:hypothetical protein